MKKKIKNCGTFRTCGIPYASVIRKKLDRKDNLRMNDTMCYKNEVI
jgi:hypothetical protein